MLVRRAADHIENRYSYRQLRKYTLCGWTPAERIGNEHTISGIRIETGYADVRCATSGYLRLLDFHDMAHAVRVDVKGIPKRHYPQKAVMKIDLPGSTSAVRKTIAVLLNELFVTAYPDDWEYVVAAARLNEGDNDMALHYSFDGPDDESLYIIEDSQIDIGILASVERNIERYLEIIADYLSWHHEMMAPKAGPTELPSALEEIPEALSDQPKKKCPIMRFFAWVKNLIKRFVAWLKRLFKRKKKGLPPADIRVASEGADGLDGSAEPAEDLVGAPEAETVGANNVAEPSEGPEETVDAAGEPVEIIEDTDETDTGEITEAADEGAAEGPVEGLSDADEVAEGLPEDAEETGDAVEDEPTEDKEDAGIAVAVELAKDMEDADEADRPAEGLEDTNEAAEGPAEVVEDTSDTAEVEPEVIEEAEAAAEELAEGAQDEAVSGEPIDEVVDISEVAEEPAEAAQEMGEVVEVKEDTDEAAADELSEVMEDGDQVAVEEPIEGAEDTNEAVDRSAEAAKKTGDAAEDESANVEEEAEVTEEISRATDIEPAEETAVQSAERSDEDGHGGNEMTPDAEAGEMNDSADAEDKPVKGD
jgi:hypothetical protein